MKGLYIICTSLRYFRVLKCVWYLALLLLTVLPRQRPPTMSGKPMSKDLNPFPQGKKNQDLLQRLNHLYQANTYLASLSRELGSSTAEAGPSRSGGKKGRKGLKRQSVGDEQTNSDALGVVARRSNHRFKVMVKHNILATYVLSHHSTNSTNRSLAH